MQKSPCVWVGGGGGGGAILEIKEKLVVKVEVSVARFDQAMVGVHMNVPILL